MDWRKFLCEYPLDKNKNETEFQEIETMKKEYGTS